MDFKSNTIDDLGRIILPKELRQKQKWVTGDKLSFNLTEDGTVIMKLTEKCPEPKCVICAKAERKVRLSSSDICGDCLEKLKKTQVS